MWRQPGEGVFRFFFCLILDPPARHLNASRQKLTPRCLTAIFDWQLPSPKLPLKMPPELPLPRKRGLFYPLSKLPGCAALEQQKLPSDASLDPRLPCHKPGCNKTGRNTEQQTSTKRNFSQQLPVGGFASKTLKAAENQHLQMRRLSPIL